MEYHLTLLFGFGNLESEIHKRCPSSWSITKRPGSSYTRHKSPISCHLPTTLEGSYHEVAIISSVTRSYAMRRKPLSPVTAGLVLSKDCSRCRSKHA